MNFHNDLSDLPIEYKVLNIHSGVRVKTKLNSLSLMQKLTSSFFLEKLNRADIKSNVLVITRHQNETTFEIFSILLAGLM